MHKSSEKLDPITANPVNLFSECEPTCKKRVIPSEVEGPPRNTMTFYIYMLTNRSRVVLYIGVTNDLENRMRWHHNTEKNSFVKKYKLDRLIDYEEYGDIRDAI